MKFGNIVRVETSLYLTKITTLQRKADRKSARSKVLAAKHTASLQLLCTVGGDLASPRTVAKIIFLPEGGWKLVVHRAVLRFHPTVTSLICIVLRSVSSN